MEDRVINNYRIVRQIGIGGMGIVYLAQHEVIERQVAIKLLRDEYIGDEGLVTRFFNEARAAAAAKHEGIVEIIDVGYDQGQAFIMMELIEGKTLGKYLREQKQLGPWEAIDITRQVANALSAAHGRDVVHRDLKPSNIMLLESEDPNRHVTKVFDFGIAKLFGENSSHTRTGILMGTPTYMSPEQCKGAGRVDLRSDLYSLGCILYLMLTGKRPFKGEGEGEVIAKHIFEKPVPPTDLVPLPEELNTLVLRLLEKDPNDRYQSTTELIAELERVAGTLSPSERSQTDVYHQSSSSNLPLPAPESLTPTPRAREFSMQTLDPDPDPSTGTPLSTPGQTVFPEPTGISKRRSLTAVLTLLVGVGALSLVLYLRTADNEATPGAASDGVHSASGSEEPATGTSPGAEAERPSDTAGAAEGETKSTEPAAPDVGLASDPAATEEERAKEEAQAAADKEAANKEAAKALAAKEEAAKEEEAAEEEATLAATAKAKKEARLAAAEAKKNKTTKSGKGSKTTKTSKSGGKKDKSSTKKDDGPKGPGTLNPFE